MVGKGGKRASHFVDRLSKLGDLTQMTVFVTEIRDMGAVSKALGKALKGSVVTSTLVAVSALAVPGLVVEIESRGVVES